jgi:hypothetical protein
MATQHKNNTVDQSPNKGSYLTKENWEVMKPFVHFAFKALAIIGGTLLAIVKLIPKALEHKPGSEKNDKVIKI